VFVNDEKMAEDFDVFASAGGAQKAVDLVYNNIQPRNGVIAIRLVGNKVNGCPREAIVQALEVGPGIASGGAIPKAMHASGAVDTTH
jgi:hypothetical protein